MNPPFRFSTTRAAAQPSVAALGEHTEAVLAELGYAPGEIAALKETGTILAPAAL